MKRVQLDWAREWMAIVSDAISIAYHSHLTTVYDHYFGDKDMSEDIVDLVGIKLTDLLHATSALEVFIEVAILKGYSVEDEKLALGRLKSALGVTD